METATGRCGNGNCSVSCTQGALAPDSQVKRSRVWSASGMAADRAVADGRSGTGRRGGTWAEDKEGGEHP